MAARTRSALHGFARSRPSRSKSAPDFARLTLSDNARTRALYPFAFALAVEYRLSADALAIAIEVANPGRSARLTLRAGRFPLAAWPSGT